MQTKLFVLLARLNMYSGPTLVKAPLHQATDSLDLNVSIIMTVVTLRHPWYFMTSHVTALTFCKELHTLCLIFAQMHLQQWKQQQQQQQQQHNRLSQLQYYGVCTPGIHTSLP
jgi:p-aminobenzoyl-glutamate transporter AbgT